ncbi:HEAT repeat domain-containing protein [Spirochaetota bacterium]
MFNDLKNIIKQPDAVEKLLSFCDEDYYGGDACNDIGNNIQDIVNIFKNVDLNDTGQLIDIFKNNKKYDWLAAYFIGLKKDPEAVDVLSNSLDYNYSEDGAANYLNMTICFALGKTGSKEAVAPLIKALEDISYDFRWIAAWALGEIGDKSSVDPLLKALYDDMYDMYWTAGGALSEGFDSDMCVLGMFLDWLSEKYIMPEPVTPIIGALKRLGYDDFEEA